MEFFPLSGHIKRDKLDPEGFLVSIVAIKGG